LPDAVFAQEPGSWRDVPGALHVEGAEGTDGFVRLPAYAEYALPLRFRLRPGETYRLDLQYRFRSEGHAYLFVPGVDGGEHRLEIAQAPEWTTTGLEFKVGTGEGVPRLEIWGNGPEPFSPNLAQGALELAGMRIRRRTEHLFDSQLVFFIGQLLRLDFGVSHRTEQPVIEILRQGVVPSLCLTVPIFLGGLLVSIVLALVCAAFRDRLVDRSLVVLATALMSVNYVVWVVAGQYILGYRLHWFPIWGFESWRYLLLPVLIGMVTVIGRDLRFYRTVMLDEMYKDYVRTARAKGVGPGRVLFVHVLRNSLLSVITNISISLPFLFMGSIVLESYFGIPGLGGISLDAINNSDVDVVRAVVLIGAVLYMGVNLVADVLYAWADPRVRLE
jgi:peptide/nickel transport system permease protein